MIITSHEDPVYLKTAGPHLNGAYFYSKEIVERIIPEVRTSRPWVTINVPGKCADGAIVFVHNNLNAGIYSWLAGYEDLILVCGVPETSAKVKHLGRPIYLPLSIDVEEVSRYRTEKKFGRCFAGRPIKSTGHVFPRDTVMLRGLEREELLSRMAEFREVYAVGRCALEAKALGCEVLPYDPRFPDPDFWQVLDNREAAKILQTKLDEIEGATNEGYKKRVRVD